METKNKMHMEHFFPKIQVKTKKKGLHQKQNTFSPQIQVETKKKKVFSENRSLTFFPTFTLRCTPIQIIGGDANVDHSQTIGGDTAKLLGGIYPPSLVSAPLLTGCWKAYKSGF